VCASVCVAFVVYVSVCACVRVRMCTCGHVDVGFAVRLCVASARGHASLRPGIRMRAAVQAPPNGLLPLAPVSARNAAKPSRTRSATLLASVSTSSHSFTLATTPGSITSTECPSATDSAAQAVASPHSVLRNTSLQPAPCARARGPHISKGRNERRELGGFQTPRALILAGAAITVRARGGARESSF